MASRALDLFLGSSLVGHLEQHTSGSVRFRYSPDWLESLTARPLSASLPLQAGKFHRNKTRPFFSAALPEDQIRCLVARTFAQPRAHPPAFSGTNASSPPRMENPFTSASPSTRISSSSTPDTRPTKSTATARTKAGPPLGLRIHADPRSRDGQNHRAGIQRGRCAEGGNPRRNRGLEIARRKESEDHHRHRSIHLENPVSLVAGKILAVPLKESTPLVSRDEFPVDFENPASLILRDISAIAFKESVALIHAQVFSIPLVKSIALVFGEIFSVPRINSISLILRYVGISECRS